MPNATAIRPDQTTTKNAIPKTDEVADYTSNEIEDGENDAPISTQTGKIGNGAGHSLSPRKIGQAPWVRTLIIGILATCILRVVLYWIVIGAFALLSFLNSGPTHTVSADTMLGTSSAHISASNINGRIYVTILQQAAGQKGQSTPSVKTYAGPQLKASDWGNDTQAIVPSIQIQKAGNYPTITILSSGKPDFWHVLFAQPKMTFKLIPNTQGIYAVEAA